MLLNSRYHLFLQGNHSMTHLQPLVTPLTPMFYEQSIYFSRR
jgi:hypothetical protein